MRGRTLLAVVAGISFDAIGVAAQVNLLYRIHGTSEPWTIGQSVSSGCIRMLNEEVIDLYNRVQVGAPVHVL